MRVAAAQHAAAPGETGRERLEQSRQQLRIDFATALRLADEAIVLAGDAGDQGLLGEALRAKANAVAVSGRNADAVELHERALALLEAAGNAPEVARTWNAMVQPLILVGRYDRALTAADRARALFAEQGDTLRLTRLEINVGNIHHRQDRFREALACYDRALAALRPVGDLDGIWSALHNRAVTLISLNDFHEALASYEEARAICLTHQRTFGLAQTDYNIAWLHYLRGDYSRAIELLQAAAVQANGTDDAYHSALCLLDLSEVYLELNLSDDARAIADQAVSQFKVLGNGYELAKATVNSAIAYGQQGQSFRAVELFAQARELFVAEKNSVWPSLVDLYQALLLFNEGRLYEARRLALSTLEQFSIAPLPAKAALCELLLARIDLRLGNVAAARKAAQRLTGEMQALEAPVLAYHAWFILGQACADLGDREAARQAYQQARDSLEMLRSRLRGEELKIAFVKNKIEVYERLVALALEGSPSDTDYRDALACIEQAKSRSLLDLIFQPVHALSRMEGMESELARSIRELRDELNWYYHLIEIEQLRPEGNERVAGLRRELGERERELARVLRDLSSSASPESELHAPSICSVEEIRAALPGDAVLVEFFQSGDRIILCMVSRDQLQVMPVTLASRVATHVRMLQFQLSKFRLGASYLSTFGDALLQTTNSHLKALFDELLAPVWPLLDGRHLVIVPHGALHYVPFHALVHDAGQVIDRCSVSYAPSGSVYARCHQLTPVTAGGALVMGIPDERAPHIHDEVREVAAVLPDARLYTGTEATLQVLRSTGAESRIVHIASHGHFRPDNPMFSGISLGDTRLNVYDLYRLQLPADLVTLSGCATGASIAAAGDELLGISRGLFLAGARSVLLSLWDVHDQSTAAFMKDLYGRIATGTAPVHALRGAMLQMRDTHPHPYYWAGFILSGKVANGEVL